MNPDHSFTAATLDELPLIADLARVIWRSHYPGIISEDQIEYMLERMYSLERMGKEVLNEGVVYILARSRAVPIGFAAYGPGAQPEEFRLHKLYLLPAHQRAGLGRSLLQMALSEARRRGASRLALAVNRKNLGALAAYRNYGFRVREAVRVEIGGGFVMDDFLLERALDLELT